MKKLPLKLYLLRGTLSNLSLTDVSCSETSHDVNNPDFNERFTAVPFVSKVLVCE